MAFIARFVFGLFSCLLWNKGKAVIYHYSHRFQDFSVLPAKMILIKASGPFSQVSILARRGYRS